MPVTLTRLQIDLPADAAGEFGDSGDGLAREVRLAAALHWWEHGSASMGRAAELGGVDVDEFMEEVRRRGLRWPVDADELEAEVRREAGVV